MKSQSVGQHRFNFGGCKPVVVETSEAMLTSDAWLLPIRGFDETLGFTRQFAEALHDSRDQRFTQHSFLQMPRACLFGILADYEDQNDHDALRYDPVFQIVTGGSLDSELASQPPHSRFENAIDIPSLVRLRDVLIDQFLASFDTPPGRLTLDIDTFDDPAHGQQQLVMFHGHYGQYQYQPRVITCAENDMVVMPCLLYGSANVSLGAADDVAYLVGRLRDVWPDIDIELRADSGFGVPGMFDECERLRIWYSIGFGMNPVLNRNSQVLLDEAVASYEQTGEPQRRFTSFEYSDRGESENRNKELKCGLKTDRLSDHRYMANLFRLFLHVQAHNLLVRIRREIAAPPSDPQRQPGQRV